MDENKRLWLIEELRKASNAASLLSVDIDLLIDAVKRQDWEDANLQLNDALNELSIADISWVGGEFPEHN